MSRQITFTADGWEDYLYWQAHDKQLIKKINALIKDCQRDPYAGIGKPEQLRHELSGVWSRRINDEHRLVYKITEDTIQVVSCRFHYK